MPLLLPVLACLDLKLNTHRSSCISTPFHPTPQASRASNDNHSSFNRGGRPYQQGGGSGYRKAGGGGGGGNGGYKRPRERHAEWSHEEEEEEGGAFHGQAKHQRR